MGGDSMLATSNKHMETTAATVEGFTSLSCNNFCTSSSLITLLC